MKAVIQIFVLIFTMLSCQPQEINVNVDNIEFDIPGNPGPGISFNGKYYCYFKTENDKFGSGSSHQFYVIDKKGEIEFQINVPEELQTFYYDLYIKNDTIFTTEYYDHNTFYLDLPTNTWIKTQKGIDLYYEDGNYSVYALDFGEWGGVTWFKNKQTDEQFEIGITTPIVNKFGNAYYLTTGSSIFKIEDPEKLNLSKEPYDYKKAVLEENYFRASNYSTDGAKMIFHYQDDDFFNPKFSLATSFITNNKLYHLYKDSISTKIGTLNGDDLVPVYTFNSEIYPFRWYYDTRNPIQNNKYQTIQFATENNNIYGMIEINENDFNVIYFKNNYEEPVLGEKKMKEWFEKSFDFYHR